MNTTTKTIKIKILNKKTKSLKTKSMEPNNMQTKKEYGQFFTTNYEYILQNFNINNILKNDNIEKIIEPFCGNGDLLNIINNEIKNEKKLECYDIDVKKEFIIQKNTLLNPPNYTNSFILTNPPYLARNKSKDKSIFDKYNTNDLYKCFLLSILENDNIAEGGVIIIPLNFMSSIRKKDIELRKKFINIYNIVKINVFEENVFDDTSYTICSLLFIKKNIIINNDNKMIMKIYPSGKDYEFILNNENNYTIGGNIYNLKQNKKCKITRATETSENNDGITNILVKCIDDSSKNKISLKFVENDKDRYIDKTPKKSARSYATLIINPPIDIITQRDLCNKFNIFLNEERNKYNSLFLTNYRESKDIARKRIHISNKYITFQY